MAAQHGAPLAIAQALDIAVQVRACATLPVWSTQFCSNTSMVRLLYIAVHLHVVSNNSVLNNQVYT